MTIIKLLKLEYPQPYDKINNSFLDLILMFPK